MGDFVNCNNNSSWFYVGISAAATSLLWLSAACIARSCIKKRKSRNFKYLETSREDNQFEGAQNTELAVSRHVELSNISVIGNPPTFNLESKERELSPSSSSLSRGSWRSSRL